ncbi:MAG: hypothetical protein GC181_09860 [Bacteroidetes bacterium]|nr:hypothetical protein [Bacteroidota bacterium]
MQETIRLSHPTGIITGNVDLPFSKSILNRMLIIKHMYSLPLMIPITHGSPNDVIVLSKNLEKVLKPCYRGTEQLVLDVEDAGTAFRFLLSFLCFNGGLFQIKGTNRLLKRPIHDLIESLRNIGFNVSQHESNRHIYIRTDGIQDVETFSWVVSGSESSQFASALVMMAPRVGEKIRIDLTGESVSLPYLDMTISIMNKLGFSVARHQNVVLIEPFQQSKTLLHLQPEKDWSAATYFFSIAALSQKCNIRINQLTLNSLQADEKISDRQNSWGIKFTEDAGGIILQKDSAPNTHSLSQIRNYSQMPDLALTEIVTDHALKLPVKHQGLEILKHKESNRYQNILRELRKFDFESEPVFETYSDHRIAMSLSVLSLLKPVRIQNPAVVNKSFPEFWEQLKKLGFNLEQIDE